jgi:hypothetical protein
MNASLMLFIGSLFAKQPRETLKMGNIAAKFHESTTAAICTRSPSQLNAKWK